MYFNIETYIDDQFGIFKIHCIMTELVVLDFLKLETGMFSKHNQIIEKKG